MKRLAMLLIAGMVWTQVTPTDEKGCAGYTPSGYDQKNLSAQSTTINLPQPKKYPNHNSYLNPDRNHSNSGNDKGHKYGNNRGHGQFTDYSQGGD